MIGTVLSHIASELNAYICKKQGLSPDLQKVALSHIVGPDGALSVQGENLILLNLIDIRQDPVAPTWQKVYQRDKSGLEYGKEISAFNVNLFLLFASYFPDDTKTGLDHLSFVIRYFMNNHSIDRHNSPRLPAGVSKLSFEMETQDFQQKGYMWGLVGSKYMPSVLYKMRMLTFFEDEPQGFVAPITSTETLTS